MSFKIEYSISQLHRRLSQLEQIIEIQDFRKQLLSIEEDAEDLSELSKRYQAYKKAIAGFQQRKELNYRIIIMALYRFFEMFVRETMDEYVQAAKRLSESYEQLPEKFRSSHERLSLSLLERVGKPSYSGRLSYEDILSNLYMSKVLSEVKISTEALAFHSFNFKHALVREYFNRVGIENLEDRLVRHQNLASHLYSHFGVSGDASNEVRNRALSRVIDDLVDRRNEVTHGDVTLLLSSEMMKNDYIVYIRHYCDALNSVLCDELKSMAARFFGGKATFIGTPVKVIDDQIIWIVLNNLKVKVGDYILSKNDESSFVKAYFGEVVSLMEDGNSVDEILPKIGARAGIKVSFKANKKHDFYLYET